MNICGNYNCDMISCVLPWIGKTHGYFPSFMICRSTSFNPYQAPGVCSAGFSVVASLIAPHVLSESIVHKVHGGQPVKEILKLVTPLRSLYEVTMGSRGAQKSGVLYNRKQKKEQISRSSMHLYASLNPPVFGP